MHVSGLVRSTTMRLFGASLVLLAVGIASLQLSNVTPAAAQATTTTIGPLEYSRARTPDNQPVVSVINFRYPVGEVWVSFDIRGWTPGTRISRIVRNGDQDVLFGDLACCSQANGRYSFRIGVAQYSSLNEGDWKVFIYVNGVQAQAGGFQVRSFGEDDRKLTSASSTGTSTAPTTSTAPITSISSSSGDNGNGGNGNGGNGNSDDNGNGGNGNN